MPPPICAQQLEDSHQFVSFFLSALDRIAIRKRSQSCRDCSLDYQKSARISILEMACIEFPGQTNLELLQTIWRGSDRSYAFPFCRSKAFHRRCTTFQTNQYNHLRCKSKRCLESDPRRIDPSRRGSRMVQRITSGRGAARTSYTR